MEKIYDIWFSSLDIKNSVKLELLNEYNTQEIYEFDFYDLFELNISEQDIMQILNCKNLDEVKMAFEYMQKNDIKLISIKDELYPNKLHNIEDKPAFLYVRGNENIFDDDAVRNCWL